ncbi:hypothetical protein AALO_G00307380, partial [Alosa alosa]
DGLPGGAGPGVLHCKGLWGGGGGALPPLVTWGAGLSGAGQCGEGRCHTTELFPLPLRPADAHRGEDPGHCPEGVRGRRCGTDPQSPRPGGLLHPTGLWLTAHLHG